MYKSIYLQGTSPVFDTLLPPRESTSDRPDAYQKRKKKKKQNSKPLEHLQPSGSNIQAAKVPPMNQRQVKPEEKGSTYEASMQFECSDRKFSVEGILFYFDQTINSYMNNNADFETYNAGA